MLLELADLVDTGNKMRTFTPQTKTMNIVLMDGGLGDHIASLVAVDYISKRYPWVKILLWAPDFLLDFANNVLSTKIDIKGFSQMRGNYHPAKASKTTKWDGMTSPMKIHLVDYAFLKLCDELPYMSDKNYLQLDWANDYTAKIFEKYVVITTGYTAKVREFPAKSVNEIAKYLNLKGYIPVFLGQKQTKTGANHVIKGHFDEQIDFTVGMDLIDKTNLMQAAVIMANANAVIGVDNGLLHVAGCTQVPIVAGFTTVSPNARLPIRHNQIGWNCYPVVPDSTLNCSFCQEKTNFLFGHDYTKCMYKDYLCTSQMTSDKFITELEKIL